MTSSTDPLGVRSHDPVERWRSEVERAEREREAERRREEHRERRATMANERAARQQLQARVAELEGQLLQLRGQVVDITRAAADGIDALTETRNDLERELKGSIAKMQDAMTAIRDRGEEEARKTFEFARERIGAVTDLPNFMGIRRVN
jgi:hypothetical protein